MAVTATEVNKLRQYTGAGMMDCKKALEESNGDFDEAVAYLRKKGQKVSAKRADKEANEGRVLAKTNNEGDKGVIIAVNCETDFVAKNQDFSDFVEQIADGALEAKPASLDELGELQIGDKPVNTHLEEQMAKIGEKITISRYEMLEENYVVGYNHFGNQIGVLVAFNKGGSDEIKQAAQDIAMQIAAMGPIAVDENDVPQHLVDQEMEVAKEQVRAEGKPDHLIEKIAQGKLKKFYQDNTLLNQSYVKDSNKTVKDFLAEIDKDLAIKDFKRLAIGGS